MKAYCDLHVHIGRSLGKPVKVTGSPRMCLADTMVWAKRRKGLHALAIVDAGVPSVQTEIKEMMQKGELKELPGGGFHHSSGITLLLGIEVEIKVERGSFHLLLYCPDLASVAGLCRCLWRYQTCSHLSTQLVKAAPEIILAWSAAYGVQPVLAHAFTPFKGYFGAFASIKEVFGGYSRYIKLVELGLSADSVMADQLPELHDLGYIASSDAHSLANIGREHTIIKVNKIDFENIFGALMKGKKDMVCSYLGLEPRLGKYYRTTCPNCGYQPTEFGVGGICPRCKEKKVVMGVMDRIKRLKQEIESPINNRERPPYFYHIPLHLIPGIGTKTLDRMVNQWGNELAIIHTTPSAEIKSFLGERLGAYVSTGIKGKLSIQPGGGGRYGRITGL